MEKQGDPHQIFARFLGSLEQNHSWSRRQFLKWSGISVVGLSALSPLLAGSSGKPLIITEQAKGIIIADPTKCVGCRRCELACTEFNDGKAKPSMARIRVARNMNFGSKGAYAGQRGEGTWGNGRITPNFCMQCPHPVPCANACPNDAIVMIPPLNARVVDSRKCVGCKMCQKACPWEMMAFDTDTNKATKCFLCHGKPKCVEACPADALSYRSWRDLTDKVPARVLTTAVVAPGKAASCNECHKM